MIQDVLNYVFAVPNQIKDSGWGLRSNFVQRDFQESGLTRFEHSAGLNSPLLERDRALSRLKRLLADPLK